MVRSRDDVIFIKAQRCTLASPSSSERGQPSVSLRRFQRLIVSLPARRPRESRCNECGPQLGRCSLWSRKCCEFFSSMFSPFVCVSVDCFWHQPASAPQVWRLLNRYGSLSRAEGAFGRLPAKVYPELVFETVGDVAGLSWDVAACACQPSSPCHRVVDSS